VITPQLAGERLAHLAGKHHFTFYEYFLTDAYGHSKDWEGALEALGNIDGLLDGALRGVSLQETLVMITSDHGNVEDLSVKTHTLNDVPTILIGAGREEMSQRINTLEDITPAIVGFLSD
jgi:bisphosphoglycerate-independent phosphoglycerate mutase (AlkP superfamily)